MKTALEIVSEACKSTGFVGPKSFSDSSNTNGRMLLSGLNRTAEDLSSEHNWLAQTKLKTFTLDTDSTYYNAGVGGYDLDKLTDSTFDRFTGSFLYNTTDNKEIPGVPIDQFQKSEFKSTPLSTLSYFRTGKFLIFFPNVVGKNVQFYYQTKNIASSVGSGGVITETDIITQDNQIPFHDARLLLRGLLVFYARFSKLDTSEYQENYADYKQKIIAQETPKSSFGFFNNYARIIGRFPNLG
jgi:hypothetical protein